MPDVDRLIDAVGEEHDIPEVERIADRVWIICEGRLVDRRADPLDPQGGRLEVEHPLAESAGEPGPAVVRHTRRQQRDRGRGGTVTAVPDPGAAAGDLVAQMTTAEAIGSENIALARARPFTDISGVSDTENTGTPVSMPACIRPLTTAPATKSWR